MAMVEQVTQWITKLGRGDPAAAELLWERYFSKLVRLARRELGAMPRRVADEEDIALSAMHSFCRGHAEHRFPQLQNDENLWKLLVTITARKACAARRRHYSPKRGGGHVRGESFFARIDPEQSQVDGIGAVLGREPTPELACIDVERLCDEFEAAWRAGQRPQIEDLLGQEPSACRGELLEKLLEIEWEMRSLAGETLSLGPYRRRFPEDVAVVDATWAAFQPCRPAPPPDATADPAAKHDTAGGGARERPRTTEPETIPERIDHFAIRRELGRGAFAVVYLADDTLLNRHVALKVPRPDRVHGAADLDHFVDEARKAAQLEHPRIVRIHHVQREPGSVYIVEQYIEGQDLAKHVESARPSAQDIARLMIDIAEAVGYAHRRGFFHRDLKPANILVDTLGQPHVADFGLALHVGVQHQHRDELAGTQAYMSPEQVRGEAHRLDGRSDIWSLGVIL